MTIRLMRRLILCCWESKSTSVRGVKAEKKLPPGLSPSDHSIAKVNVSPTVLYTLLSQKKVLQDRAVS